MTGIDLSALSPAAAKKAASLPPATLQKMKESSQNFEAVFLSQFLNGMTEGLGQDSGFDGGSAEGQWRGILNENYAHTIAQKGGIGIGTSVLNEMLKMQGA